MAPALFILAILGCGEADAPCRQVAVTDTVYSSATECSAQTAAAVARYQEIDYPVVVAECRPADAKPAQQLRDGEVKLPEGGKLPPQQQQISYKPGRGVRS